MAAIDTIIRAAIDGVKRSGVLESGALMAVVSVVNTDGTLSVTRGADVYPRVRVLSGYQSPAVSDKVEILRTAGGWVCVGELMNSSAPRTQRGSISVPAPVAGQWSANAAVTFPKVFAAAPTVIATPSAGAPAAASTVALSWTVESVTTSGFNIRQLRGTATATTFGWIATDF